MRLFHSTRAYFNRWLAVVNLLVLSAVVSGCTHWFFYPQRGHVQTPNTLGYEYQDVFLPTVDGERIHAWLIEPKQATKCSLSTIAVMAYHPASRISRRCTTTSMQGLTGCGPGKQRRVVRTIQNHPSFYSVKVWVQA